jgi:hypothetical protein
MSKTPKSVMNEELIPVIDSDGIRRCAWHGCTTALSVYNEHIVCRRHVVDYAVNYLPIAE